MITRHSPLIEGIYWRRMEKVYEIDRRRAGWRPRGIFMRSGVRLNGFFAAMKVKRKRGKKR